MITKFIYRIFKSQRRFSKVIWQKYLVGSLTIILIAIFYLGWNIYSRGGVVERNYNLKNLNASGLSVPIKARISDGSCSEKLDLNTPESLVCIANSNKPEILIIGDSHAQSFASSLVYGELSAKFILVSANGCLPFENGYVVNSENKEDSSDCSKIVPFIKKVIRNSDSINSIYIVTRNIFYLKGSLESEKRKSYKIIFKNLEKKSLNSILRNFIIEYTNFIQSLPKEKFIYFVIDWPEIEPFPKKCLRVNSFTKAINSCGVKLKKDLLSEQGDFRTVFKGLSEKNKSIILIDPTEVFCKNNICSVHEGNNFYYYDYDHLSTNGSRKFLEALGFSSP